MGIEMGLGVGLGVLISGLGVGRGLGLGVGRRVGLGVGTGVNFTGLPFHSVSSNLRANAHTLISTDNEIQESVHFGGVSVFPSHKDLFQPRQMNSSCS